ncbi:MAG TPA: hypothetical protein VN648_24005 [Candidatus Methylomirabilis sp.]|nr:hypothetical protein [Candidatus Methylomirabilis sp.]
MAVVVKLDQLSECRGRKTDAGWEWERGALVVGVSPSNAYSLVKEAAEASGMPDIGDPWPGMDDTYLQEISPVNVGAGLVRFRLVYRPPPANGSGTELNVWHVSISGSLATIQTNKDSAGNVVSVSYTWPTDKDDPCYPHSNPELAGKTRTVADLRSVPRPEVSMIFSRRTLTPFPLATVKIYCGVGNTAGWSIDPTAPARSWLIESISYESAESLYVYTQRIQMRCRQWSPIGWDSLATFVDRNTGYPPSDLVDGTGIKTVHDFPAVSFDTLVSA